MSIAEMKRAELFEGQDGEKKDIKLIGKSLFCFSKDNCLRRICYKIVK